MNVIFDCGQVLFRFEPKQIIRYFFDGSDEDAKLLEDAIFTFERWGKLDTGEIREAGLLELAKPLLPVRLHEAAAAITLNWFRALPEMPGVRAQIEAFRAAGHRIYLLSNISLGFAEGYREVPAMASMFDLFDGLVFSAKLGIVKPDRRIFDYIMETYALVPSETVFIDDSQKNVAAAEACGIRGIRFTFGRQIVL